VDPQTLSFINNRHSKQFLLTIKSKF